MKIAIPVWEGKISPVLDTASRLVIFNVENKNATLKGETHLQGIDFIRKCSQIKEMRVDLLICGAVSRHFGMMLAHTGVRVIPWIAGSAEEVLNAYMNGKLFSPRYIMPGCRRKAWSNFGDSTKKER
jgi:predicted Fe-Mo cluster-binding NifX family protein